MIEEIRLSRLKPDGSMTYQIGNRFVTKEEAIKYAEETIRQYESSETERKFKRIVKRNKKSTNSL